MPPFSARVTRQLDGSFSIRRGSRLAQFVARTSGDTMARKSKNTSVALLSVEALFKPRDEVADAISSRAAELAKANRTVDGDQDPSRENSCHGTVAVRVHNVAM